MANSALIGHTGFVGGNLAAQHRFDSFFNSKNIEQIAGRSYELLVVSAMPAAMWIANQDPNHDRAVLDRLMQSLQQVRARQVIVMSTVAVYPIPIDVDEQTFIDEAAQSPYGRHRLMLERQLADQFSQVTVVRLPAIFGSGLKKNAVYDLLHDNEVHKINAASRYQYFNLDRLWADILTALAADVRIVNFATEPVSMREVAQEAFGFEFTNENGLPPATFDVRSKHAGLFGGRDGYLYDRRQVLDELRDFVRHAIREESK